MESHTHVPFFIEANSKKELVKKMFENNAAKGGFVKYFDIQKDGAKYVAWYYEDLKKFVFEKPEETEKVTKKVTKKAKKKTTKKA